MPRKATDPFMGDLWNALIADTLGPGGHRTGWDETPVRIRNRFIRAVRQVMQSGAAFQASAIAGAIGGGGGAKKTSPRRNAAPDPRAQRELLLPLLIDLPAGERPNRKTKR
jgi:hypothetical protein